MSRNVQSITEWRCLIYGLQQNVNIKYNGIQLRFHRILQNTEAETTEFTKQFTN